MSDGMGREFTYLSSHATNRYFIPNWCIYGNFQLSTVTLGIDDIDLSCDMMKNKPQKTWNISLLFVYLQRKHRPELLIQVFCNSNFL